MRGLIRWIAYGAMLALFLVLGAVKAASADLVDASCDARSIWLFDKPGLSGNVICLSRDAGAEIGFDALNWFTRPGFKVVRHWGGAVRSFQAGSDPGYFRLHFPPFTVERFVAYQRADSVSQTVADAYVLALTEPGATRWVTFTGWRFGIRTCAVRGDPGSGFSIAGDGESYIDTQIPGMGTPRSDGLIDCSYSISWPLHYGITYHVSMAGSSCYLTLLENSIRRGMLREEWGWLFVDQIHFYDGTCWPWSP